MTLEEAIKHCEEIAQNKEEDAEKWRYTLNDYRKRTSCEPKTIPICKRELKECLNCASEHRQLAEWLRELKAYREILANADKIIESRYGCVIVEGYADVIDQMREVNAGE